MLPSVVPSGRLRRSLLTGVSALAMLGCERRPAHDAPGTPGAVPPQVLAIADTAETWVGEPSPPGTASGPVLLVLWSPTDPSCLEMLPTVEAWHEAYARFGLRVVGIEFAREATLRDSATAAVAVRRLGVRFASAVSGQTPPAALAQQRGPLIVLRDGADRPARWLDGPGAARAVESALRSTLRAHHPEARFPDDPGDGAPADSASTAGAHWKRVGLAPGETSGGPLVAAALDQPQPFTAQFRFQEEPEDAVPVPIGWWTPRRDGLEAARPGAANLIAIRYDAAPVGLVMSPPVTGSSRVWVLQDERWIPASDAGEDVRFDSKGAAYVEASEARLYWIAKGGRHALKLSPDDPGIRFYAFQFGPAGARP